MKMGRPLAKINRKKFEAKCAMALTLRAVSRSLGVSPDTVQRWCLRNYGQHFREVRKRLRSAFLDRVLHSRPQKVELELEGLDTLALGLPNLGAMSAEEMQEFAKVLPATPRHRRKQLGPQATP